MKNYPSQYIHTDLAAEGSSLPDGSGKGTDYSEEDFGFFTVARLHIKNDEGAEQIGKPIGRYVTVAFPDREDLSPDDCEKLTLAVSHEIERLARDMCPKGIDSVLVAGLGNRNITSDSLGPLCTDSVNVTRHLRDKDGNSIFPAVSAIAPGVLAQTGIETLELIRGAAENCRPSLVIVIDALAARSVDRLARTVQLSDTGISPGSGIGNHRKKISSETIGCPVMAVGVPTVVDSATLVLDALERAGISEYPEALIPILEQGSEFFVTLKDSDAAVDELSRMLFDALNLFFFEIGNNSHKS
ncbi:MAG: GPR endopeptidase [Ruminococcaceae bacterium]|nr:GPR endopeptidase [Oscillospiraceae bacterium]